MKPFFPEEAISGNRILTGIHGVDAFTRGLDPGSLHAHAALMGELKTKLALNIFHHVVVEQKKRALFVSYDQGEESLHRSLLSIHSKYMAERDKQGSALPLARLRSCDPSTSERDRFVEVEAEYNHHFRQGLGRVKCPIERSFEKLRDFVHPQSLVVLDQSLLMRPSRYFSRLKDERTQLFNDAKVFALEQNVVVLLLVQLGRTEKLIPKGLKQIADLITIGRHDEHLRRLHCMNLEVYKSRDSAVPVERVILNLDSDTGRLKEEAA